jgi:GrpB-like predicted nucleotidyltransferase (UPF0157 family)
MPYGEWGIRDLHVFRKSGAQPARNLYVCIEGCLVLRNHPVVWDVYRRDASVWEKYGRVKMEPAGREWEHVDEYCDAKDEVVA